MHTRRFRQVVGLVSFCLLAGLIGSASGNGSGGQLNALAALHDLQANFHGATTLEDADLMYSLWADDAVFHGPNGDLEGPEEITDFLTGSPNWGKAAALSPTYKTWFDIQGNTATFYFECVFVKVADGLDPLTETLSTIPFGDQNDDVVITQHSRAYGKAVKSGNRWVFKEFGPPPPP